MLRRKNSIHFYVIILLFAIASLELVPNALVLLYPDLSSTLFSSGRTATAYRWAYRTIGMSHICFMAYNIALIYLMILVVLSVHFSLITKTLIISSLVLLSIIIVFPIVTPINLLLMACTQKRPFLSKDEVISSYPELRYFEKHFKVIRKEYDSFVRVFTPNCFSDVNPFLRQAGGMNGDKNCWRSLFLKRGGVFLDDAVSNFPNTMELLDKPYIHNAFFSILDPNVEIPEHEGYYKGYLRYHLGVVIPDCDPGCSEMAYIVVGGKKYHWKQGKGVVFDDMFTHYVKNPTGKKRVVLFVDLIRKDIPKIFQPVNRAGIWIIEKHPLLGKLSKNQHKTRSIGPKKK